MPRKMRSFWAVLVGAALVAAPIVGMTLPASATESDPVVTAVYNGNGTATYNASAVTLEEGQVEIKLVRGPSEGNWEGEPIDLTTDRVQTLTVNASTKSWLVFVTDGENSVVKGSGTLDLSSNPEEPKKVFVCKYVGKPGVDERLKGGKNPISVSVNAIPDYNGVGSYFADGQDRSFVLAEDNGQPDPDVSECPKPEGPPPPTKVKVPATPEHLDPCNGPGVTNNVVWKDPLAADTDQIDWSENATTKARTAALKGTAEWKDGTTAPKVFELPADSGVVCTPPPAKTFTVEFGQQVCVPSFGPGNTFNDVVTEGVAKPAAAASVSSSVSGNTLEQSFTPNDGYEPEEGVVLTKSFTDDGGNCGHEEPPADITPLKVTTFCGGFKLHNPNGEDVFVYYANDPEGLPAFKTEIVPAGKTVEVKTGYTKVYWGAFGLETGGPAGDGSFSVKQSCDNPVTPDKPKPTKPSKGSTPVAWHPPSEDDGDLGLPTWVYAAFAGFVVLIAAGGTLVLSGARRQQ